MTETPAPAKGPPKSAMSKVLDLTNERPDAILELMLKGLNDENIVRFSDIPGEMLLPFCVLEWMAIRMESLLPKRQQDIRRNIIHQFALIYLNAAASKNRGSRKEAENILTQKMANLQETILRKEGSGGAYR